MQRELPQETYAIRKHKTNIVTRFLVRMLFGAAIIFCVNTILDEQNAQLHVGINPVSLVTTGRFGVPGVALLYGIMLYEQEMII